MSEECNVVSLHDNYLKTFAVEFVDVYVAEGRWAAGKFAASKRMTEERLSEAKGFVTEEFERRGWTFPEGGEGV